MDVLRQRCARASRRGHLLARRIQPPPLARPRTVPRGSDARAAILARVALPRARPEQLGSDPRQAPPRRTRGALRRLHRPRGVTPAKSACTGRFALKDGVGEALTVASRACRPKSQAAITMPIRVITM